MRQLLVGKKIIVTGTARGMGKQMVETFAVHGASVIALARTDDENHRKYCSEIAEKYEVSVIPMYAELTDTERIKQLVKEIRDLKMEISGLVNNAGITYNALFQMSSLDAVRRQMEVNFFAPFALTQYITKMMVRNGKGSVVNISSTAALDGNSGKSAYGASKAALLCMSNVIAEELGSSGIRSNTICPGVTQTDMLVGGMPEYALNMQIDATFLKKIGTTSDIANMAAFLLSDCSSYITGQVFRVDGGVTQYEKRKKEETVQ